MKPLGRLRAGEYDIMRIGMAIEDDLNKYAEPIVTNTCPLCGEGWPERHEWITEGMVVKLVYVHALLTHHQLTFRQARQLLSAALSMTDHE